MRRWLVIKLMEWAYRLSPKDMEGRWDLSRAYFMAIAQHESEKQSWY